MEGRAIPETTVGRLLAVGILAGTTLSLVVVATPFRQTTGAKQPTEHLEAMA